LVFELDDTGVNNITKPEEPLECEITLDPPTETHSHFTCESPDDVRSAILLSSAPPVKDRALSETLDSLPSADKCAQKSFPLNISINSDFATVDPLCHLPPNSQNGSTEHLPLQRSKIPPELVPLGPEKFLYKYATEDDRHWQEAGKRGKAATLGEIIDEVVQRRHRTEARERHPGRFRPSCKSSRSKNSTSEIFLERRHFCWLRA
jgi:hypothetical protein